MSNPKELMSRSGLFEEAPAELIEKFLQCADTVRFNAREIPLVESSITEQILMITEGRMRIEIALQAPDHKVTFLDASPGTFLGLVNFFDTVPQPCTATALTDVTALCWNAKDWQLLCEADPQFGYRLSQRIGRELVERMARQIDQLLNTVSWGM